jgi:N-acetylglucosaminyldiphosphoundecaprenol N-acetyl-beta-D-mannosaminyltransferase
MRRASSAARAAPVLEERDDGHLYIITLGGTWHDAGLKELRGALARATARLHAIRLELLADCSLDSAALGLLLLLYGHQSKAGAALEVRAQGASARRTMRFQNVQFLLEGLADNTAAAAAA